MPRSQSCAYGGPVRIVLLVVGGILILVGLGLAFTIFGVISILLGIVAVALGLLRNPSAPNVEVVSDCWGDEGDG